MLAALEEDAGRLRDLHGEIGRDGAVGLAADSVGAEMLACHVSSIADEAEQFETLARLRRFRRVNGQYGERSDAGAALDRGPSRRSIRVDAKRPATDARA
jgi:hypothetical protein